MGSRKGKKRKKPKKTVEFESHGNRKHSTLFGMAVLAFTILIIILIHNMEYARYSSGMTGASVNYEIGKVIEVTGQSLKDSSHQKGIMVGTQQLVVKILTGKHKGDAAAVTNSLNTYHSVVAKEGQKLVIVVDSFDSGEYSVMVYNYYRIPYVYLMAFVFFAALILVGGKKGMLSGLSLIYTFTCIFLVFLPLVLRGVSPVWAAILLVIMVSVATMIFINGTTKKSMCAILGTTFGVVLSGVIMYLFGKMMHISGYNTDEAESLLLISQTTGLKVKDLLFSGILIASLGAVMDTAVTIVSSVYEIRMNMPDCKAAALFRAGMNVGKDMIGTMSNTLILAFTGTSVNFIIIMYSYSVQYNQFMNMDQIAIETAQALSGSLAIILTVPLTAAISAKTFSGK